MTKSATTKTTKRVVFICVENSNRSQIADPKEMPPEHYREVRDLIEAKVKQLLASFRA